MVLDLNQPADDDYYDAEPNFYTQVPVLETVDESPNPVGGRHEGLDDEGSGRGAEHNAAPQPSNPSIPATTTIPTTSTTNTGLPEAQEGHGVAANEEVASSPSEPFLGMRFDTIAGARAHYNSYALRLGFSIKSNTSKRATYTNVLEKQQFCCNKHRAPKTEEEIQKERLAAVDKVSPVQVDSEDEASGGVGPSKQPSTGKFRKKRRRESVKPTKCPANMIVKWINNKWEVTYFVAEHNHPLIEKPDLVKYLRSHRGIPPDERQFLRCLHDCNIETGLCLMPKIKCYLISAS